MVSSFILLFAHAFLLPEKWCFILFKFVSKKIGCGMRPSFTDHISHMSERSVLFCWKYIVVFIFPKLYYFCVNAKPLYWTFQLGSQLWNACRDHRVVNDQINVLRWNKKNKLTYITSVPRREKFWFYLHKNYSDYQVLLAAAICTKTGKGLLNS